MRYSCAAAAWHRCPSRRPDSPRSGKRVPAGSHDADLSSGHRSVTTRFQGWFLTSRSRGSECSAMTRIARILLASFVLAPSHAFAQLVAAADGPVVYGHHHVAVSNVEAHKKFWADTLGGTVVRIGTDNREVIKVPNVWIFFRAMAPTGGSKGSTADHIAFSVPNL